ncbi:MAG: hypothetical protein KJ064_27245, partial [Anaerolineae bacterium]|nr:hypothetical protein [Anaerolineae bacterium]
NPLINSPFCCLDNGVHLTTTYQQNSAPYVGGGNSFQETEADLFLNWTYRAFSNTSWKTKDIVPNSNPPVSCYFQSSGCSEVLLGTGGTAGTNLLNWMDQKMNAIFTSHTW